MLRYKTKSKLIDDIYDKIADLPDGKEFTVRELFTEDEWNNYSIEKQRFMISEFQFMIRTSFEDNDYYCSVDYTELGNGKYKNEKPTFNDNVLEFDEDTSIQKLFHYTQYLVKEIIDDSERFLLKDLFPGFIWNRFSHNQKISLGILFQRYNEDSTQEDYALVDVTKQGRNVYTDLWDRYEWTQSSHEYVDIKRKDFIPNPSKLPSIIKQTRKMK